MCAKITGTPGAAGSMGYFFIDCNILASCCTVSADLQKAKDWTLNSTQGLPSPIAITLRCSQVIGQSDSLIVHFLCHNATAQRLACRVMSCPV